MKHSSKKNTSLTQENRTSVSPFFQTAFILASLVISAGLLYKKTTLFNPREQPLLISPITPEITKQWGSAANVITVGLYVSRFENFNMTTKEFIFDGILWFQLVPDALSIDTLSKFSFENGTIIQKSEPTLEFRNDMLVAQYSIRVRFTSELDYADFPIDTHRISLILVNRFVTTREINFQTHDLNFKVIANVSQTGWDEVSHFVSSGYIETILSEIDNSYSTEYPATLFQIDYARNSIRYALSILLPLAIIFYIILFSISLPLTTSITITSAGITAILAYRFVIENLSPRTGYFMLSDYLFFMFLGATVSIFIMNVTETSITLSSWFKKVFVVAIHTTILATITYLLLLW